MGKHVNGVPAIAGEGNFKFRVAQCQAADDVQQVVDIGIRLVDFNVERAAKRDAADG